MQSLPAAGLHQDVVNFLANVQTWYNQKMADILIDWKATTDVYGGNLLANTIIPYVTEVAETTHSWNPLPAFIFGGSALGMKGGQFLNGSWPMNIVLADHRPGLLQEHHPARQPAGDERRRHGEHLRPHRRRADRRAVGRAVRRTIETIA